MNNRLDPDGLAACFVASDLEPALGLKIKALLLSLDQTEEGRLLLEGLKKTRVFDQLPPESELSLEKLKALMKLVSE